MQHLHAIPRDFFPAAICADHRGEKERERERKERYKMTVIKRSDILLERNTRLLIFHGIVNFSPQRDFLFLRRLSRLMIVPLSTYSPPIGNDFKKKMTSP